MSIKDFGFRINLSLQSVILLIHILHGILKKIIVHDIWNKQYKEGGE